MICFPLTLELLLIRYHELYDPPSNYDVRIRCVRHPRDNENNIKKKLDNYYYFHTELADFFRDFKVCLT